MPDRRVSVIFNFLGNFYFSAVFSKFKKYIYWKKSHVNCKNICSCY